MSFLASAALSAICSCSSSNDPPEQCKRTDREGTYRLYVFREAGDCPDFPSETIRVENGVGRSADEIAGNVTCTSASEKWSDADCKFEATTSCKGKDGSSSTGIGVSRQVTQDGSRLEGTATITIQDGKGMMCRGTYRTVATRL